MIVRFFCTGLLFSACVIVAGTALAADAVTFQVIYNNQGYNQPAWLIEGSPGVFYLIAGSGPSAAFSVTTQGTCLMADSTPPSTPSGRPAYSQ